MTQFIVLSNSHKDSKLTDPIVEVVSSDIATNSAKAKWMIPNGNARSKMVSLFFNDFVIYQSVVKPYKFVSNILCQSASGDPIGYGLRINQDINSANSINDDENQFIGFIRLLTTSMKWMVLSPLRIGFGNCFAILLMNYHQHHFHQIIFKNLYKAIRKTRTDRERRERNHRRHHRHPSVFIPANPPNIVQLDYVTICRSHRRQRHATKLVTKMINDVYSGYGDDEVDSPSIYVECDQQSLLFWRNMGFEMVGIIDNVYDRWRYRAYSMLYHRDNSTLSAIIANSKQLFQDDNTLHIEPFGLSLDFNDDNISNIHFAWQFPPRGIMEVVLYLFKFRWCAYVVDKVESVINFNPDFTNWQLFKMVLKVLLLVCCFWACVPLMIVIGLCRRFSIGAWDT